MRSIITAFAGAAMLTLTACGGQGDDARGDNVADAADAAADNLEDQADNATNETAEETLENQADAVREGGTDKEEAIDDADGQTNGQ